MKKKKGGGGAVFFLQNGKAIPAFFQDNGLIGNTPVATIKKGKVACKGTGNKIEGRGGQEL